MSYVLQTRAMDDSQTGANMYEFLKAMADDLGIEKNDLVLVTDDAFNMSLAADLGNFLLAVKVKNNNLDISYTIQY